MPWTQEKRDEARARSLARWHLISGGVRADPLILRAKYRAETLANRARINAILRAPENLWKPKPKPIKVKPRKFYVSRAKVTLAYPFLPRVKLGEHADLMAVNALVPRGMPGREDVCQEIMLALLEGTTSIAELTSMRGNVTAFIKRFRADNMEASGQAISLDAPRFDGTSWHDILAAPEAT